MDIRKKEDELFEKWLKKDGIRCFIKDGCPSPDAYSKAATKVVFILKDANFGEERINSNSEPYDQRRELKNKPDPWWGKLRDWCAPIINPEITWKQVKKKGIQETLACFAFIQLKKNAGGGSVQDETLAGFAIKFKEEIRSQIVIYQPDFIVCCGVGSIVYNEVLLESGERKTTPNGVGYWKIKIGASSSGKVTYIIDFCHPSARYGNRIAGLVAFGLSQAIAFLKEEEAISRAT